MNITTVKIENLRPADWRATYIFKPELRLLADSLADYGWTAPIVVRTDGTIIDGFSRWLIAQSDPRLKKMFGGEVPVVWVDCDEAEAMIMHVRLNRARGQVIAKNLSRLLKRVARTGKWTEPDIQAAVRMSNDEFDTLIDGSLVKSRSLKEHEYSKAWVPVEAPPAGAVLAGNIVIERPPNADR
jgi:ParB-like chromosome segregation protein Spo0J